MKSSFPACTYSCSPIASGHTESGGQCTKLLLCHAYPREGGSGAHTRAYNLFKQKLELYHCPCPEGAYTILYNSVTLFLTSVGSCRYIGQDGVGSGVS